jgi:hypothetical protein
MYGVRVDGVRELTRAFAKIDPELRKELGRRNKDIGERIVSKAWPKPTNVGTGSGARPRPSASANVLRIQAGGSWRAGAVPVASWGSRYAPREAERPYLVRQMEVDLPHVEAEYFAAIQEVTHKVAGLISKGSP